MKDYLMMEKYKFTTNRLNVDLSKCTWFTHENRLYFTDNENPPMIAKEAVLSFILRKLRLSKTIYLGKPEPIITNKTEKL